MSNLNPLVLFKSRFSVARTSRRFLAQLLPAIATAITLSSASAATFKIMTAGDSITAFNSYQAQMRTFFTNGGHTTTWVGTMGSAPTNHEGWSGKGLDHFNWPTAGGSTSMRDYMNAQFGTTPPPVGTVNVVTLMLGINNMDHGLGLPGGGSSGFPDPTGDGSADGPKLNDNPGHDAWITSHVDQLVNTILNHPSNVKLVIAKIPPVGRGRNSLSANFAACISRINRLNTTYQTKYDGLTAVQKDRVRIVDHNSIGVREYGNAPTFDWGTEVQQQGDWVHPRSDAGIWAEMGQSFYNSIVSFSAPTFAVSGTVTLGAGGQTGVTLSAGSNTTVTDANGNYSLNLSDGSYTLTPSLSGFTYTPATRSVTVSGGAISGQNFTATALPTYTITGTITLGAAGLNGVTVSDGTRTATTNASGSYTLNSVPQGSFTITPSLVGYSFSPVNRSGTLNANLAAQNFAATFQPATHEGFVYPAGANALANKSGGNNWSGAWDSGSNDLNALGSTYSSGGELVTSGGKAIIKENTPSFRSLPATYSSGTYWISFLARSSNPGTNWGGLSLFDSGNERLFFGQRFNGTNWGVERSGGSGANSSVGTGNTTLIVAKIVLQSGADNVFLWFNPALNNLPLDSAATQFLNVPDFSFNRIRLQHGLGAGQTLEIDEIRFGSSYAQVTPVVPQLTGLELFRNANGLAADGTQDNQTPAADGVENLLKYAFNMIGAGVGQASSLTTPNSAIVTAASNAGLPLVKLDSEGKLQITATHRKVTSNSGITMTVEFSDNMAPGSWAVNPAATTFLENIDSIFEKITVTDHLNNAERRFVRVKVTAP